VPQIDGVSVTNISTGVNWVTGQYATVPTLPLPVVYTVYVNADNNNQPPVGFLNNPNHQYVVQGRYLMHGGAFVSGLLQPDGGDSEPPRIYAFS
jgi:hypothetical protein